MTFNKKDQQIIVRLSAEDKDLIRKAARKDGDSSMSVFIRRAAMKAAESITLGSND